MRLFFFFITLLYTSCSGLFGQSSQGSIRIGLSIIPQTGSLCNADKAGQGRFNPGYQLGPNFHKKISNKLTLETGIHLQKANFKQRYHEYQWPSDVIDGHWDPTRSYEQYEAKYFALGFSAGLNFKMSEKVNFFSLGFSAAMQRVFHFEDQLIINESGYFHYYDGTALNSENNQTQFLLGAALNYNFVFNHKINLSIGPSFEYSTNDLLKNTTNEVFKALAGGHPLLFGIRFAYNGKIQLEE